MAPPTDPIYLDHNASTPLLAEVRSAMLPYLTEHFGNPSSGHVYGRRARDGVEQARRRVATLAGCEVDEVLFTSGGTEANNLAILGIAHCRPVPGQVITSVIEHPATEQPCRRLEAEGWTVDRVGVDSACRVRTDELVARLGDRTILLSVMHANNETGTIQPLAELARAAHAHDVLVHTDAAQSAGKLPIDMSSLGADLLSIAGHKLYAPKGVGALCVRRGTPLSPVLAGAGHERGLRPGTENVASIVGLGEACHVANQTLETEAGRLRSLRDQLWQRLTERIDGLVLNGHAEERLPNTLNVRFPSVRGSALLARTPQVAASTGSACHEGAERPSAVLTAMGLATDDALGSVRLSLGRGTTTEDIELAAAALVTAFEQLRDV